MFLTIDEQEVLEKEMATHSSSLAWRIPWTEEPGRLQSMELQRVRHDWANITHSHPQTHACQSHPHKPLRVAETVNHERNQNYHLVPMRKSFSGCASKKEFTSQSRRLKRQSFDPWTGKIPWRRQWQPTPVFLPGESHGQRSLVGCSPRSYKESDTTEHTHMHVSQEENSHGCRWMCWSNRWMVPPPPPFLG